MTVRTTSRKSTLESILPRWGDARRSGSTTVHSITGDLGIEGWSHLDPVLLAALALQAPLLLIGEHGTAKSLVIERVAVALGQRFRHYNASLLNYDDLVGIPVPDENGQLRYLGTAGAVWDAEFVFFDEINRCRLDLQNKLFPLVHERRIAGEDLPVLVHRWAAINPPDGELSGGNRYLGIEELDPALADRFWFHIPVPTWRDLDRQERLRLVEGIGPRPQQDRTGTGGDDGSGSTPALTALVDRTIGSVEVIEATASRTIAEYVVTLVDQLAKAEVPVSPRRARLLVRAIIAVHAARFALGEPDPDLESSAERTLLHALPQRTAADPLPVMAVVAAHRQAWEVANDDGGLMAVIIAEPDPVERVAVARAHQAPDALLARLVQSALGEEPTLAGRAGLGFVFSRALHGENLDPAAWNAILTAAAPIDTPGPKRGSLSNGGPRNRFGELTTYCAELGDSEIDRLQRAFLNGLVVALCSGDEHWRDALETFMARCERFGVRK